MVEIEMGAPGGDAGADGGQSGLAPRLVALLAPPAFAAVVLAGFAAQAHGLERFLALGAILAVATNAVLGVRASRRTQRIEAAIVQARGAIDGAIQTTRAAFGAIAEEAVPALEATLAKTAAMASDRRLSPAVRGRLTTLRKSGEDALAKLQAIVGGEPCVAAKAASQSFGTPVATAPADPEAAPEAAAPKPAFQPVRPLRVLAAEANGVHQLVLRTLLAQIGVEPEIVAESGAVIEAWRREPWDLILMDLQSPQVDGLAVARMIRMAEAKGHWEPTPILGLAAQPSARDLEAYETAGVTGWVGKPLVGGSLFDAVEEAIAATPVMATAPVQFAQVA
jgi:CheY-like chemotaxis protein